jgi:glycerol kinase
MESGKELILAIDQGTTGSTVVLLDVQGRRVARASREFPQHFPEPGRVEHEPEEIWQSVLHALADALSEVPNAADRVIAIGITNQRETIAFWDSENQRALGRALVWQDRRTSSRCASLQDSNERVRAVTGLVIDPYFSASKVQWVFEEDPSVRAAALNGTVRFGTIDSYLIDRLCDGKNEVSERPLIEATNAARTLLMDLRTQEWSEEMCALWGVPRAALPQIVPSAGTFAKTKNIPGLPDGIPVTGIAGDQHAALFGQGCVYAGDAKCTYGTGAFVLVNTGDAPLPSEAGLLTTLAWQVGGKATYALEGASFIAGAAVQWLRDGLGLIESAPEVEQLARTVTSADGVTFVPALSGLGAPYWDPEARGLITGITRGTTKAHLARATLEAIAYQVDDLLVAMGADLLRETGTGLTKLRVDGGASQNDLLMQMQADISALPVDRPVDVESTARGAGLLAALGVGALKSVEHAARAFALDRTFTPALEVNERIQKRTEWEQAVARARLR